jgi:gluconokinase
MVIVLMGVSGSGKTTIGQWLAERLECVFHDADDDHPPANVEKMASGEPLTEADRHPWLETLRSRVRRWVDNGQDAVLACSALTKQSRAILGIDDPAVKLVYLSAFFSESADDSPSESKEGP